MSTAASTLEKALELYNYLMPLLIFSGISQMSDVTYCTIPAALLHGYSTCTTSSSKIASGAVGILRVHVQM